MRDRKESGGYEPELPICPLCGRETDTMYKSNALGYIGCDNCVTKVDAWDAGGAGNKERKIYEESKDGGKEDLI